MLIDTHVHLFSDVYTDIQQVIERAKKAGIGKMIVPGLNLATSKQAVELAKEYPGVVYAAVGIHPEEINKQASISNIQTELQDLINKNRELVVAIGEVGTDANSEEMVETMDKQMNLLRLQAELASKYNLPLIIHTRKSLQEALSVLDNVPPAFGVFHSFSYDLDQAREIIKRGFVIGIGGSVSYSKRIQKVVKELPSDKYILETDAPYTPRDFINEPSSVTMLAQQIANLRDEKVESIINDTTNTAKRVFNL